MSLPNPRLSHAVLIGTGTFSAAADLPSLPAVHRNVVDLQKSLTNPGYGILDRNNCATVIDPETPHEFMAGLRTVTRQVDDFLLVYYAGHGVRHATRDDLYLTLKQTETDALNGTAVPLDWVKQEIEDSPARVKLLILDCCYSGLAVGAMSPVLEERELEVRGSAVIASSPKNAKSHSPAGQRHTAFTGQLVTLLDHGSPNEGEVLTLGTMFHRVSAGLARAGLPRPMFKTIGTTSELLLRQPVIAPPPTPAPPPRTHVARTWVFGALTIGFALAFTLALTTAIGLFVTAGPIIEEDEPASSDLFVVTLTSAGVSAALGVLLSLLGRRWWPVRGNVAIAVVLAVVALVCCVLNASLAYTEPGELDWPYSVTLTMLSGLEAGAACGYALYRRGRQPS